MFKAVRSKKAQTRLPMFHFLFMVSLLGEKKKKIVLTEENKKTWCICLQDATQNTRA